MEKIERLLTLMNALLASPRAMSAESLRSRVPGYPAEDASFQRSFERDKNELRDMGVPLLVEPIPGSDPPLLGYRIRPQDYELRDPGLDPDELEALNLAAAATGFGGGISQQALFKLGGSAPEAPTASLPVDPDLGAAFAGVAERSVIGFRYHDVDREVHPYRLQFVRGRWYLNGFDRTRGEDRWFRMDRVQGRIAPVGGPGAFVRPQEAVAGLRLEPWVLGGTDAPVDAEVWFDPAVAPLIRKGGDEADIVNDDRSGLVVRLKVTNWSGFTSWLLTFLDRAEVLGPPELRDAVVAELRRLAHVETGAS